MAFVTKEWKDRLTEFAGRRRLANVATGEETIVDVTRNEGTVSQEGDAFSAANMNDLEQRIADEFGTVNNNLATKADKFNLSTTEVDTGQKWIDGKPIYSKTIAFDSSTTSKNVFFDHNISNIGDFRAFDLSNSVCQRKSDDEYVSLNNPAVVNDQATYSVALTFIMDAQFAMQFGSMTKGGHGYVTLRYTKK